jgi:hypothetical protein
MKTNKSADILSFLFLTLLLIINIPAFVDRTAEKAQYFHLDTNF